MAYLNGNCTFLKPSLELEVVEGAERPTQTKYLSVSASEIDFWPDPDSGKVYIYAWNELQDIPNGTEVKTVSIYVDNKLLTAADISEQYDGYEWIDKTVRFVEYAGSIVLYALYLGAQNELFRRFVAGAATGIEITYYTE